MDFITSLMRTSKQHDSIMVVVDRLSKVSYFILVKTNYSSSEVAEVFIREIMRLHGVPKKIMSYMDAKFTSKFWKALFARYAKDVCDASIEDMGGVPSIC